MTEVAKAVEVLEQFYGRPLTDAQRAFYVRALGGHDLRALGDALAALMRTQRYLPTVAEIAQKVRDLRTAAWQRTRSRDSRTPLSDLAGATAGKPVLALMLRRLRGECTHEEYLADLTAFGGAWSETATAIARQVETDRAARAAWRARQEHPADSEQAA